MSLRRALVIARVNLVRLLRDRLGLFFIVVLPMMIVFVTGLQFGGGFAQRVALVAPAEGRFAGELADGLAERWEIEPYDDEADARDAVATGRAVAGVVVPDDYDERLLAGDQAEVRYLSPGSEESFGRRRIIEATVAEQASLVRAARFTADELGGSPAEHLEAAEDVRASLSDLGTRTVTVGDQLFPEELQGFALGAQGQLVLFVFLTSLTGAAQLILTRQLGVSRRMLASPISIGTILVGEALGRFGVALFQALFIVIATALLFGVTWGDPIGAGALVLAFSAVGAAVAMLIGAVADNAEQAGSLGVFAGLGIAALGGSMVPPEIFPEPMATISWFTPHRWALDGFRELIAGGGLPDIVVQLAVVAGAAALVLALATWRLRAALTR